MNKTHICTTSLSKIEAVKIISCPADEIDAMLPLAEQYYHEDKLPFDAARFQRALATALAQDRGSAWWLCVAGERVGYALMMDGWSIEFGGLSTTLDEIFVLPRWRGKGVASQAIIALRDQFASRGGVSMSMETTPDNLNAQKLYQRLGFADTQRPVFRLVLKEA